MAWTALQPHKISNTGGVTLSLSIRKHGRAQLILTLPSPVAGPLGLDKIERVNAFWGEEDHIGQLLVRADKDGAFKPTWFKGSVVIRLPDRPGLPEEPVKKARCSHTLTDEGLVVALPDWAWKHKERRDHSVTSADPGERPARLAVSGTILVCGNANVRVSKSQADMLQLLIENFGRPVRKQTLFEHLYSLDPNGGAEEKILDVWIHKLRGAIEQAKLPIAIVTHRGVGWELRGAEKLAA